MVATSIEALFPPTPYTLIPTADIRAGKMWKLTACGIMSFASTGTLILNPFYGTSTGGVTMGANSTALPNQGVTTAQPWWLEFMMTCRTVGLPGVNSTFIGHGFFMTNTTFVASTSIAYMTIGGTVATGDPTLGGICIGKTLSVAGTMTTQQIALQSLN